MAVLKSVNMCFDFRYVGFEYGWIKYHIYFRWKDEPIVKNSVLKRWNVYWDSRPGSAFLANDEGEDRFLPFVRQVLETDQSGYWEPIDPDVIVAIYPEAFFPFLKPHYKLIYENEESKRERMERERLKKERGKLPDDLFTIIVFIDTYNFKEADAYSGQGFGIHMIVERRKLEKFTDELEQEYRKFRKKYKLEK